MSDENNSEGGQKDHPNDGPVEAEKGDEGEASQERSQAAAEEVGRVEGGDDLLLIPYSVDARIGEDSGDKKAGGGKERSRRYKTATVDRPRFSGDVPTAAMPRMPKPARRPTPHQRDRLCRMPVHRIASFKIQAPMARPAMNIIRRSPISW